MKTRNILLLSILCMQASPVVVQALKAQNTPAGAGQNEPVLSGSGVKSEDVVVKVDAVFVGQITQMGFLDPESAGAVSYGGVQVKVLQVLRGSVDPQVNITLNVREGMGAHEAEPKVGSTYIFFAKKNAQGASDQFTVLKLLLATDNNIAKVKALIAAAPAGK